MSENRPRASRDEVERSIREIREYHRQGRASLRELPERGRYGQRALDEQAERLGWNVTRLRKARQFADPAAGYSREQLNELFRLLRAHRPVFGTAHAGVLVTASWAEGRAELQRLCLEGNWSKAELEAHVKARLGPRRFGGRRRRVAEDPIQALVQLDEFADSWQRWYAIAVERPQDNGRGKSVLDRLPEPVRIETRKVQRAVRRLREAVAGALERARAGRRRGRRR
jgi:hypothetical protein